MAYILSSYCSNSDSRGSRGSQSNGSRSSRSSKDFPASFSPSNTNSVLFDYDPAEVLPVDRTLLNPKGILSRYVFTHKAIWCSELMQSNILTDAGCIVGKVYAGTDYLEHWAFVARGHIPGVEDMVAFFVAQFGEGDYIPTLSETRDNPDNYQFHATLVENDKRLAALLVCATKEKSRVWTKSASSLPGKLMLDSGRDVLSHPGGGLVCNEFEPGKWHDITNPLKLGQINELIFRTQSAGKNYSVFENNCQAFAQSLFNLVA